MSLKKTIKRIYLKEQFKPSWLGLFINPFYFSRKSLYDNISLLIGNVHGKVLDIGCGNKPYRHMIVCDDYIGLEVDTPQNRLSKSADVYYDGESLPFETHTFDSIISTQVLEHVFEPEIFLEEAHKVLKDDGFLLLTVPLFWPEHEKPYDYGRYTSMAIKYVLEKHNFELINVKKLPQTIQQ